MRERSLDRVHHGDGVGARLAVDGDGDGRDDSVFVPPRAIISRVFDAVDHIGDVGKTHRRSIAIGNDLRGKFRGVVKLALGVNHGAAGVSVELAGWLIDAGARDRVGDLVDADAAQGQSVGIDLNANRLPRLAENIRRGDAIDCGELSEEQVFDIAVDIRQRQRGRARRQIKDRAFGRIDLPDGRRRRHVARKLPNGR